MDGFDVLPLAFFMTMFTPKTRALYFSLHVTTMGFRESWNSFSVGPWFFHLDRLHLHLPSRDRVAPIRDRDSGRVEGGHPLSAPLVPPSSAQHGASALSLPFRTLFQDFPSRSDPD